MQNSSKEVKLYAQEPAFTSLDHEFLALLSINVCADDIATHITPDSFVFSPFVDWFMLLPLFLKEKDPVLYVGNEILDDYGAFAQSEEKREKLKECNELGQQWLEKRCGAKLREFEMHPHALNGMIVYWVETEQLYAADKKASMKADSGKAGDNEGGEAKEATPQS